MEELKKKLRRKAQVWIFHAPENPGRDLENFHGLLLQTNEKRGQFWQPVTGSVEGEETYAEGALREAQEETGFTFTGPLWPTGYGFHFESKFGPAREEVFVTLVNDPKAPVLDPKEHQNFQWVALTEAEKFLTFETNLLGLQSAIQEVKKRLGQKQDTQKKSGIKNLAQIFLVSVLTLFSSAAFAAQDGRIIHDGAAIRAEADIQAPVLEVRKRGQELRISSEARDGWFKTRTTDGNTGWIHQSEIIPSEFNSVLRHGDVQEDLVDRPNNYRPHRERGNYFLSFRVAGGYTSMMAPPLNLRLGYPFYRSSFGPLAMAQLNFHFSDFLSLAVRGEYQRTSWHTLGLDITQQALPLMVGLEYTLDMNLRQRTYLATLIGVGLGDQISVSNTDVPELGSSAGISAHPVYLMVTLGHEMRVASWFAFFMELELRASQSLSNPSTGDFLGANPAFRENGNDIGISIANHGVAGLLGMEFIF